MVRPTRLWTRRSDPRGRAGGRSRYARLLLAFGACMVLWFAVRLLRGIRSKGRGESSSSSIVVGGGDHGAEEPWLEQPAVKELPKPVLVKPEGGTEDHVVQCKAWNETALPLQRLKTDRMYDKALPPVKPTPGAAWRLTVSDSMEGNWLGVRNLDRRYVYGSKLADQRYRANGYCRVHMPSIPRAGSTWFRTMFEVATGRPTASVWPEGGRQDAARRYHIVDGHACGANPAQMEGNKLPRGAPPCRNLTAPAPDDPVLMKSHTPFFPSYDRPALDPGATCAVLLIVRNPLDAHDAWRRYAGGTAEPLRKWLPVWAGHLTHWVADTRDLPIIAFRYEDLLWRADKVLEQVLRALGPGWEWSRESIERAVRTYGPREPFEDKCGKAIPHYTLAEVEMVRKHYAGLLGRFGYAIEGAGGAAPPQ